MIGINFIFISCPGFLLLPRLFSSCGEWGLLWSQCVDFSLWCLLFLHGMGSRLLGLQQLQLVSSVVGALRL